MKKNTFRAIATFFLLAVFVLPPSESLLVEAAAAWSGTPEAGGWTGVTSRSHPMSFTVRSSGTQLEKFKLKMTFSDFMCSGWVEVSAPGPISISGGSFRQSGGEGGILGWTFSFTGSFDSVNSAQGTYTYNDPMPSGGCPARSQSGTWTATIHGGSPPSATCLGKPATIVGTGAGETINGTAGDDVIVGRGGDDTINGRGGNDRICGNGGDDTINGGPGNDRVHGGPGDDVIAGGSGADVLKGGAGADYIDGGRGNDTVIGGPGLDACFGETKKTCEM